mgnify:CR=1 FL=1
MAIKVGLDTMVWIHWIAGSDNPEHDSIHDVMRFLLDVKNPAEIILLDMVEAEIEYKIRTNNDLPEEERKQRLNQLEQAQDSDKVFVEKARMNESKLKAHVAKGGDFQDAVILSQISNSMANFFITADSDLRRQAEWDEVKQVMKPGSALKVIQENI